MQSKEEKEEFAIELLEAEIPVFGEFKIFPNTPPFLMKLDLAEPPDGKLTYRIRMRIGEAYAKTAYYSGFRFALIAGFSKIGKPLAESFAYYSVPKMNPPRISFGEEDPISGKITINGLHERGSIVLGIGDVASLNSTNTEAIQAILLNGLYIMNYICLLDWGLGEKEILKQRYGIELIPVFTIEKLLSIWRNNELLTKKRCDAIIERRDDIKEHINLLVKKNQPVALSA